MMTKRITLKISIKGTLNKLSFTTHLHRSLSLLQDNVTKFGVAPASSHLNPFFFIPRKVDVKNIITVPDVSHSGRNYSVSSIAFARLNH